MPKQFTQWFTYLLDRDIDNSSKRHYWYLLRWLMPNGGTLILLLLYIGISRTWGAPASNPPLLTSATEINFSGYLADDNGNPITGDYDIKVAIYDQATGGTLRWGPETHFTVPVAQGNWTLGIGSVSPGGVPSSLWSGDRYLQITVNGEVLSPRQLIRSVPIAGLALTVPDASIDSRKMAPQWYRTQNIATVSTTSYDPVPTGVNLNFTCDIDCVAFVAHRGLITHSVDRGRVNITVKVDGQTIFQEYALSGIPTSPAQRFAPVNGSKLVSLVAGAHTVSVYFSCSTPGTCEYYGDTSVNWEELSVLLFAQTP